MATSNEHANASPRTSTSTEWLQERSAVLDTALTMFRDGLVTGTSGNVSARCGDELVAVTASSKPYEQLTLDDIVVVDFDGEPVIGDAVPSTELLMHVAIYRARPDVGAVMHTHSVYASALAVAGVSIPPLIDEMVVNMGDSIQVSQYTYPGTEELGERVVEALGERNAVLIRNHGLVGVGPSPVVALQVCRSAERIAHIYAVATALGNPQPLPPDVVETELELFRMRRTAEQMRAGYPLSKDQR